MTEQKIKVRGKRSGHGVRVHTPARKPGGKSVKTSHTVTEAFSGNSHDAYGLTHHSSKKGTLCPRPFARTPEHAERFPIFIRIGLVEMDRISPNVGGSGYRLPQPPSPDLPKFRKAEELYA